MFVCIELYECAALTLDVELGDSWNHREARRREAELRRILSCLDGFMNIALEQTEEYSNGQLKNKYGDAFIRGNNGTLFFYFSTNLLTQFVVVCSISA
uniref:Sm domain-containing protein n=1 Tax=Parascaris equorum TaxID=6256 RepID=A0A914S004_PAREQ